MNNTVNYKGYYTIVSYDSEKDVLYGKIEDINDLVTFECKEADNVKDEFEKAVDDYLKRCNEVGKTPDKGYNGLLEIKIPPHLHRNISFKADGKGISLNSYITQALVHYLENGDNDAYIDKK